ncbi:MAG: flagellar biosynthetic protein FliR [Sphingomonadales bacterium]|nr:flagellar biosynthetic protein FliR [Sphingomonadales bacterium]
MINLSFGFGPVEAEFWRWLFVMTRIGAAMLAAPFFGAGSVPPQVRVIVTGAVAILVCAWTPVAAPPALLSANGLLTVLGEVLVGLSLGFVLQLSFAAPTIAAEVIGGSMGMAMVTAVDPNSGTHSPALGQYFAVVLTVIFLALGGHLHWLALVIDSYTVFPPGQTWLGPDKFMVIAGFATTMFTTAVAIALPVTLVLLVVQVVTGVLSRSAPALNLFALGLPAGVLAGIAALIASAPLITDRMTDLSANAIQETRSVLVK